MVERQYWFNLLQKSLQIKPIVWLAGVRRSGKTTLCHMIEDVRYFDCELPSVRNEVTRDGFLDNFKKEVLVFDEIHRLDNPSELLKIAADYHPRLRVIATGSSTLAATAKFRDSLTGRKTKLWLTPANSFDIKDFSITHLNDRLTRGGLPPFLLAKRFDERAYQEWLDSFWAKDIQELFRLAGRHSFLKFFELILSQSGGIFEAQKFATSCEVSRGTIANYLSILETMLAAHIVRPFSKRLATEIVSAPKVYAFDTGFVAFVQGVEKLTAEKAGLLFEHWVLNEFHSLLQDQGLHYWRDKAGHEIDFVWQRRNAAPVAIECKWNEDHFDTRNLRSFRHRHPEGENILITPNRQEKMTFNKSGFKITYLGPGHLAEWVLGRMRRG